MLGASLMFAVAGLALLAARPLHVGSIVALLCAGIAIGGDSPFSIVAGHAEQFQAVGQIGVILLVFAVALDVRPGQLWASRRIVAGVGAAQYFGTTLATGALLLAVTPAPWNVALTVALGLAMTSSAVSIPYLESHGEMSTARGRTFLAVDVFQSFMVAPVLLILPILAKHPAAAGMSPAMALLRLALAIAAVAALTLVVLPRLLRWASRSMGSGAFSALVLGAVLFGAWITDWAGASAAGGAFVMGLALANSVFASQIKAVVAPARQLLVALFFISIGMAIDPRQTVSMAGALLLYVPAIFVVKVAVGYAVARGAGLATRDAAIVSLLLMPLDEIAFVIFAGARDAGLIDARGHALSLAVLSASFLLAPLAIEAGYRLASRRGTAPDAPLEAPAVNAAVLLVGYGQIGRMLCTALEHAGIGYRCIDDDLDNVARGAKRGHSVTYGRIDTPSSLWAFGANRARLVVVAAESFPYAASVVERLREFQPDVPATAGVLFLAQRDKLRALGCDRAFAVTPEGGLDYAGQVLRSLGTDERRTASIVDALRRDDYGELRPAGGRS
jgi:Kef-type K+ transport system membrane component KefB